MPPGPMDCEAMRHRYRQCSKWQFQQAGNSCLDFGIKMAEFPPLVSQIWQSWKWAVWCRCQFWRSHTSRKPWEITPPLWNKSRRQFSYAARCFMPKIVSYQTTPVWFVKIEYFMVKINVFHSLLPINHMIGRDIQWRHIRNQMQVL